MKRCFALQIKRVGLHPGDDPGHQTDKFILDPVSGLFDLFM